MPRTIPDITIDRLHALFRYEPEEGRLVRRRTGREVTGLFSRKTKGGYAKVNIDGRICVASRVIWAMHTGQWPPVHLVIDHINGDTHDNRISNLRPISNGENIRNSWRARPIEHARFKTLIDLINNET